MLGNYKIWKLEIAFFALLLFLLMAKNVDAAVLQKAPNSLGLVGYWSFNEGTGTTTMDYSGNNNKGTLTGMASPSTPASGWNPGRLGKALSFDGVNQYVKIPHSTSTLNIGGTASSYTVTAWFKTTTSGGVRDIVAKNDGTSIYPFSLYKLTTNELEFLMYDGGAAPKSTSPATINDGKWHFAAGVRDVGTDKLYLYLDGNLVDSDTDTTGSAMANTDNITIGNGGNSYIGEDWNGLIDEVRIYNRALSAGEVSALYQSGAVKFQAPNNKGLVGYWSFNEGTSTIALDYSGNNNKGTLTSMASPSTPTSGWNPGRLGKALNFDGSNDYVDAGSGGSLDLGGLTAMSASVWFKPGTSLGTTNNNKMVLSREDGTANCQYRLGYRPVSTSNRWRFIVRTGGTGCTGTSQIVNGVTEIDNTSKWYHVVGIYDGTNIKLYVNGALDATAAGSGSINTDATTPFLIGKYTTNTIFGLIDEARIYNRALSAGEVSALYQSGAVKFKNPNDLGLVGYWSFNEGTSTIALDYSGNGNKGTLTSMASPSTPASGWNPGRLGKALSFDGSNDYVDVRKTASLKGLSKATISLWYKARATPSIEASLYYESTNTNGFGRFALSHNSNGDLRIIMRDSNISTAFIATDVGGGANNIGKWIHLVATVNAATDNLLLYRNGIQVGSNTTAKGSFTSDAPVNPITIGAYLTNYIPGLIDEVRIYNRALSASEVKILYNSGTLKIKP